MDGPDASGAKVFGRFTEPAHQVLDLAREEAEQAGHRFLGPEHLLLGLLAEGHNRAAQLLGVLEDAQRPGDTPTSSRRHRQVIAHVGLPDGYHGAAGPLLAGLGVDLGRLREAVAAELGGSQR